MHNPFTAGRVLAASLVFAAFSIAPTGALAQDALAQDELAEAGEAVFKKCQACHSLEAGRHRAGPSLAGIFGAPAASADGYLYSPAMEQSGLVWDARTLDTFLTNPREMLPGSRMFFPGLRLAADRDAVVAFLQQLAGLEVLERVVEAPAATLELGDLDLYQTNVKFALKTAIADGRLVYVGVGGDLDGIINPTLTVTEGDVVQITLINGEGAEHDFVVDEFGARSEFITGVGSSTTLVFKAEDAGDFFYYCSVGGHREAGMEGLVTVVSPLVPFQPHVVRAIVRDPADLPPPINVEGARVHDISIDTIELDGVLDDGMTYRYWTFDGQIPGPFLRVRVGDTINLTLNNDPDSAVFHSIDLHAVTGPGGGAAFLQVAPGESKSIAFKAIVPGLFVYHCATPLVAHHISNGMYGMILVEPEEPLPTVDREFYVMQGELYTQDRFGTKGQQFFSVEKLLNERPEYFTFNGAVGALTTDHPLMTKVGETVRIYFGVGGPNYTSAFHVIGEMFDRAWVWGGVINPPELGIQTVNVPPGGALIVDFKIEVPGRYILVDHALSRMERGLVGFLYAEGEENEEIYHVHDHE
jgi:nitrite reductase (NO-forming)